MPRPAFPGTRRCGDGSAGVAPSPQMTSTRHRRSRREEVGEVSSIPLVDLSAQHAAVATEVADGWSQVLADTAFIGGPQVASFENDYAAFIETRHCVALGNGTDAIEIALRAFGVG